MRTAQRDTFCLDLHRQHLAWTREGYDGHNRHGGITTMAQLRWRRTRRRWNRDLARWRQSYEPAGYVTVVSLPGIRAA